MRRLIDHIGINELATHIILAIILLVSIIFCQFGLNDKPLAFSGSENENLYLDPIDTAFTVEKISGFTPNIAENLGALKPGQIKFESITAQL